MQTPVFLSQMCFPDECVTLYFCYNWFPVIMKYHSNLFYVSICFRLGAGWSVHTNKFSSFQRVQQLTIDEQEQIMNVIARADMLEEVEQERIG